MIPATLSFLHTVHIFSRTQPLHMVKPVKWETIVGLRNQHQQCKLELADVAVKQKKAQTLQQYMVMEDDFLKLMKRDDQYRRVIARLITKYFQQQKT